MPYCPQCGEEVEEGKDFCPECGASLQGGQRTPRPARPSFSLGSLMSRNQSLLLVLAGFFFIWLGGLVFAATDGSAGKASTIIMEFGGILLPTGLVGGGVAGNDIDSGVKKVMIIMGIITLIFTTYIILGTGMVASFSSTP